MLELLRHARQGQTTQRKFWGLATQPLVHYNYWIAGRGRPGLGMLGRKEGCVENTGLGQCVFRSNLIRRPRRRIFDQTWVQASAVGQRLHGETCLGVGARSWLLILKLHKSTF